MEIRADMAASVIAIEVHVGDQVSPGTPLLLLESMKMEIPVLSEGAGSVREVRVRVGDVVQEGDLLVVLG